MGDFRAVGEPGFALLGGRAAILWRSAWDARVSPFNTDRGHREAVGG
jgi:hypothetical protein